MRGGTRLLPLLWVKDEVKQHWISGKFGSCLEQGEDVPIDLKGGAHYYKLADQGIAAAQNDYGDCLKKDEDVSIDLKGAAYYLKVSN
jgi:TPR repeat protein